MKNPPNSKLSNPELEAEIYYLTAQEGGRQTGVATNYRGQFFYDNHNWDAEQKFLGKEYCELGQNIKVLLRTASPDFHCGKFFVGKKFEIREGARIVGKGTITKILRDDFNYWDGETFIKSLHENIKAYSNPDDLKGYQMDFDYLLPDGDGKVIGENIQITTTDRPECMMIINANALTRSLSEISEYVFDRWKNRLALRNNLYKTDFALKSTLKKDIELDYFKLSFATWDSMYLTGEIIVK